MKLIWNDSRGSTTMKASFGLAESFDIVEPFKDDKWSLFVPWSIFPDRETTWIKLDSLEECKDIAQQFANMVEVARHKKDTLLI